MKTIFIIIFTTYYNGSSYKTMGTYYFKTKKIAEEYAKKFKNESIGHVEYKIEPVLKYDK